MLAIDLIVPSQSRLWHRVLLGRLDAAGHDVGVRTAPGAPAWPLFATTALKLERRLLRRTEGLSSPTAPLAARSRSRAAALTIDLAGTSGTMRPSLTIVFDGNPTDADLPAIVATGRLPEVEIRLNGRPVERGSPMLDHREFASLGANDVLARVITLTLKVVATLSRGETPEPLPGAASPPPAKSFLMPFLTSQLPRLVREVLRRSRYQYAHWSVGYRLHDGPGVAEGGALGGGWSVLPDDGSRFFADPFPFQYEGQRFIFVEDYLHATRKARIAVSVLDANGIAAPPIPVLEEPFHLSYPQVFEDGGTLWMLPESSANGRLTLYRATQFPVRWTPETVLIEGEISDATLLRHDGRYWLFATDRDGYGSTSDTLVVFHAPQLTGHWTPHRDNPIVVDRQRARPGGGFVRIGDRLVLPMQDGTLGYGGGLGLLDIAELDEGRVGLGSYRPIDPSGNWPYPKIHTLNRAGRLEVIDGIAARRKCS